MKKLSHVMEHALTNIAKGKDWHTGLHWGRGRTAASVHGGLSRTLPALRLRGLIDFDEKWEPVLTDEGLLVAHELMEKK